MATQTNEELAHEVWEAAKAFYREGMELGPVEIERFGKGVRTKRTGPGDESSPHTSFLLQMEAEWGPTFEKLRGCLVELHFASTERYVGVFDESGLIDKIPTGEPAWSMHCCVLDYWFEAFTFGPNISLRVEEVSLEKLVEGKRPITGKRGAFYLVSDLEGITVVRQGYLNDV